MNSYYASPERKSLEELVPTVESISNNPIVDGLMRTIAGLFAVLNSDRQILAVNNAFIEALNLEGVQEVLGLRPGEALKCVHAWEEKAGCGTSKYCSTCGAAISIVTSLAENHPEERLCALHVNNNGVKQEVCLSIRAVPIDFDDHRYILLFAKDVSGEQVRSYLERIFYHDVNNMVMGLVANTEMLLAEDEQNETAKSINRLSWRLKKEFDVHRLLTQEHYQYEPHLEMVALPDLMNDLFRVFCNAPFAQNIRFVLPDVTADEVILTDYSLLLRVLMNMLTNAFEASGQGSEVRLWYEYKDSSIVFHVSNESVIPPNVQLRIFQRHYSSKADAGRGLGTYSMKLIGEKYLGGRITFISAPGKGTTFSFSVAR